jgi:hypothetical protein
MSDSVHDNNLRRLSEELSMSKKIFRNYSQQLLHDNAKQSEEVMKQLSVMRSDINETVNKLSIVVKILLDKIGGAWQKILPMIDSINEAGYISWLIGLISCSSTLVVTLFLLVPLSCTCCNVDNLAGMMFQMASCVLSIFCTLLGFFSIFEVLFGGHGEVFVCRALYEKPEYTIIGKLFDNPGIIYSQLPKNGIIADLFLPTDSKNPQEVPAFINTSLTKVLGECEMNKSAYNTFQVENLLNMKKTLDYENYPELVVAINNLKAHESSFTQFTQRIQFILNDLMHDSDVNFTSFRMEITQISPEKEMSNFIDQMQRVSLQISDAATATRMSTLGSTSRRIQSSLLQPLEILKNEIVFQLTALELQIEPWMAKIKELQTSFNHSQKYLDRNSAEICSNFSENFRDRIRGNLEVYKNHTLESFQYELGCRSIFDIFDGIRLLACRHIIEPINGKLGNLILQN